MSEDSSFNHQLSDEFSEEKLYLSGSTCDTFIVRLYGKLHFKKKLKEEYKDMPQYVAAFQKEFEVGFQLEHPSLPRYVKLTYEESVPCIYEEYIEGDTLTDFMRHHPDYFHNRHNANLFIDELLSVMAYLHDHQVLFLDLKPDNAVITSVGNHLRLVDLGGCHTDAFTNTEAQTKGFSSPEKSLDERSDIYLIGRLMEYANVPHIYNNVVAKCLEGEPSERYQSVRELQLAVNKARKQNKLIVLLAIALACILLCLTIILATKKEKSPITQQPIIVTSPNSTGETQGDTLSMKDNATSKTVTELPKEPDKTELPKTQTKSEYEQMTKELHKEMDKSFNRFLGQIASDSIVDAVTFSKAINPYSESLKDIEKLMVKKYPNVLPATIHYEIEKYISETIRPLMQRVLR